MDPTKKKKEDLLAALAAEKRKEEAAAKKQDEIRQLSRSGSYLIRSHRSRIPIVPERGHELGPSRILPLIAKREFISRAALNQGSNSRSFRAEIAGPKMGVPLSDVDDSLLHSISRSNSLRIRLEISLRHNQLH